MLLTCPDCEQPVSAAATSCPHCGRPTRASAQPRPRGAQTTEATGKGWKFCQLLGALGTIACGAWLVVLVVSHATSPDVTDSSVAGAASALALLGLLVSFVVFIFGRIGAWWFHG